MALAAKIKHFLDNHHVVYRVLKHKRTTTLQEAARALALEQHQVLQAVLLKDSIGVLLAVLPLNACIDWAKLSKTTGRQLTLLSPDEANNFFNDCEPGSYPPFGSAYGILTILDKSMEKLDVVYFEAGCHTAMIQLSMDDLQFLMADAAVHVFCCLNKEDCVYPILLDEDKGLTVEAHVPALPCIAQQLLEITHHYFKEAPYKKMVEPLQAVIPEVNTTVVSIAHWPEEGPLELQAFWRYALQSAVLAKKISQHVSDDYEIDSQLSYLAGFFHHFGYLLFGCLFPHEFRLLNRWLLLNPKASIETLEKRLLGMGQAMHIIGESHTRLGAWLMTHWQLPEPIIIATRYHHCVDYKGAYATYVKLIQLVTQLLKMTGIEDGHIDKPDYKYLEALGVSWSVVKACIQETHTEISGLNSMASELAN